MRVQISRDPCPTCGAALTPHKCRDVIAANPERERSRLIQRIESLPVEFMAEIEGVVSSIEYRVKSGV